MFKDTKNVPSLSCKKEEYSHMPVVVRVVWKFEFEVETECDLSEFEMGLTASRVSSRLCHVPSVRLALPDETTTSRVQDTLNASAVGAVIVVYRPEQSI